jgi:DNA-directed RNA polymerase specialized sigma54-like protein
LHGLLNAVYQQKLVINNLLEIHKVTRKKEYVKRLSETDLIVIRNKIGAHSANFISNMDDSEHKFDVYEISRPELERGNIRLRRNQKDSENYDLNKSIKDFDKLVEEILSATIGKVIKKIYQNQGDFFKKHQIINKIKDGWILFNGRMIEFSDK